MMQILKLVEDEQKFSTLFFMNFQLKNWLNEGTNSRYLMYFQAFYNLNTFPYDACYDA
jgi:hypothetical protein